MSTEKQSTIYGIKSMERGRLGVKNLDDNGLVWNANDLLYDLGLKKWGVEMQNILLKKEHQEFKGWL
eukprot:14783040-Ditylum_brightwellii.AAC.1